MIRMNPRYAVLAFLAVAILAAAICILPGTLPGNAMGSRSFPSPAPVPPPALASPVADHTLFIEPGDGRSPITSAIDNATRTVNLTIYNLNDPEIVDVLVRAVRRGVSVRVIYNADKSDSLKKIPSSIKTLKAAGAQVRLGLAVFPKTHQKTFTIDGNYSLVMTCNLKPDTFSSTRDFIVTTRDPSEIAEIEEVFDADWNDRPAGYRVPALVWSPDHARATILSLTDGARTSIVIYNENLQDTEVIDHLIMASSRGVSVRVLVPGQPKDDKKRREAAEKLIRGGVAVREGTRYYIHAKILVADYDAASRQAFAGSQNFEAQHLDKDRELGILVQDREILARIHNTFEEDWETRSQPVPPKE